MISVQIGCADTSPTGPMRTIVNSLSAPAGPYCRRRRRDRSLAPLRFYGSGGVKVLVTARMAVARSGSADNEQRWQTLMAQAHAAFLQVCSLKLSEASYSSPSEEFLSVSQMFFLIVCCMHSYSLLQCLMMRVKPAGCFYSRAATASFIRLRKSGFQCASVFCHIKTRCFFVPTCTCV